VKRIAIFILIAVKLGAQSFEPNSIDESADPDEGHYLNELFATLFQSFDLEIADSSTLDDRGFSLEAISSILKWQAQGAKQSSLKKLEDSMSDRDSDLLESITWNGKRGTGLTFRQRLQTSASMDGWRTLHKGRVRSDWGNLVFLLEQDPGEASFSDHSILTLSSNRIPTFQQVILGDFHVRWGAGLILNQQGLRSSLNPNSLRIRSPLSITPHFSSRETDYFRGIAGQWTYSRVKGSIFLSSRQAIGVLNDTGFHEDSDGIHPVGKQFQRRSQRFAGMAGLYDAGSFIFFSAITFNPQLRPATQYELGMTWQINDSQLFQIFTDQSDFIMGRSILVWSYSSKPVVIAIQYRNYDTRIPLSSGSVLALLGSAATNESGIAVRTQIRPGKNVLLRYSLDTGFSAKLYNLKESDRVVYHKSQVIIRQAQREWQLDFSLKRSGPITPSDIWRDETKYMQITKLAVSIDQKISKYFNYRLNMKTASNSTNKSALIQQRMLVSAHSMKASVGFVRFVVPDYTLRLSIYESSLLESFSFYTAFEDGQRWFIYLKRRFRDQVDLELRLAHSRLDRQLMEAKQLDVSFQLSVVL